MDTVYVDILPGGTKLHQYYINAYLQYIKDFNSTVHLFSIFFQGEDLKDLSYFSSRQIILHTYVSEEGLLNELMALKEVADISYLNTFAEQLIPFVSSLKQQLGFTVSDTPEMFANKKIQREKLLDVKPKTTVSYLDTDRDIISAGLIHEKIGFPCIMKPKVGQESSGVQKIHSIKDIPNNIPIGMIFEEYIDGPMYSIDYFVDAEQSFTKNFPVYIPLATDIGIDDFFNLSRIVSHDTHSALDMDRLYAFIGDNILACGIRNTFIHHEFKYTSKGEFKTIELNGRIGGYRLEMYQQAYDYHLLSAIHGKDNTSILLYNIASIAIYPVHRASLRGYNYDFLEVIKKLESFYSLRILPEKYEGKEVGLTRDGFSKLGTIKLKNSNLSQFKKDYDFIIENYKDLLILSII